MPDYAYTIIGVSIIFVGTALGAAFVFFFKKNLSGKVNSLLLGFAGGVMIAASIWSLLIPAIDQASSWGKWSFVPAAIGFIIGGLFLVLLDKIVPHFHMGVDVEEGPRASLTRPIKMFLAITIHNIPEGLAVGFAFGGAMAIGTTEAYITALGLAIGVSIQNVLEGATVSLPMCSMNVSKGKSFLFGAASGIVEPIAAVIGLFLASYITILQPWMLAFAAGAMIYVVAEDLIPEAGLGKHSHYGAWGVMAGFVLMMILDIALG